MKVFQDFISKLDSTEKHESNFDNLCIKKGGSFQKERFSFLLKSSMGGLLTPEPPPPPVRTPLTWPMKTQKQQNKIFYNMFIQITMIVCFSIQTVRRRTLVQAAHFLFTGLKLDV